MYEAAYGLPAHQSTLRQKEMHSMLSTWLAGYKHKAYLAGTAAFKEVGNNAVTDLARYAACACYDAQLRTKQSPMTHGAIVQLQSTL